MGEIWEMHRMLTSRDVVSKRKIKCCANKMTLKLKVSIVAISEQTSNWGCLEKEQWKECKNCILCGVPENVDCVFCFQCAMARFIWASFKEALGGAECHLTCKTSMNIGSHRGQRISF